MKKLIALVLAALVILGGAVTVCAAEAAARQRECFVDANNDGVCDSRAACIADGTCAGNGQGCGGNGGCGQKDCFVDADQDGTCDNRASCQGAGRRMGRGCGRFAAK